MIGYYNYQQTGADNSAPHHDKKPLPSREELLKRKSFGSVNDNKHLTRMLEQKK